MVKLVATDSSGKHVGCVVVGDAPQTIGRSGQSGLQLPSTGVSRTHASVYLHDGQVVINDEGSANGVRVNGQLISGPTIVDDASTIQISTFRLIVRTGDSTEGFDSAPDTLEDEQDTHLEVHSAAGGALARRTLALVGRGGPYDGSSFQLEAVMSTVGRDDENDVVLEDSSVSRRHAQLRLAASGDRVTVLDLRSANGTFLDGQRVKRAEALAGSVIRFGDVAFKLVIESADIGKRGNLGRRKRVMIAAGSVLAFFILVLVVGYFRRPKIVKTNQLTAVDGLKRLQAEIDQLAEDAKRKIRERSWTSALGLLEQVVSRDPLNDEARKLRALVKDEQKYQEQFENARDALQLGPA